MSTAIIVSGTLRHLVNASSSWTIPGDYFLVIDQNIYTTPDLTVVGDSLDIISENIRHSHVKFKSIFICVDSNLPKEVKHHSSINMINKWKLAYYNILPYNTINNYERIILLRPDLYLYKRAPTFKMLEIVPENNTIYSTIGITTTKVPDIGTREIMNDVLLMCNLQTFSILANEFGPYYLERYAETQNGGYEIHSMLARFVKEKGIAVMPHIDNYFEFSVLRNNSSELFVNGVLLPTVDYNTIRERSRDWWKQVHGK
jgi:hypothetical protein